MDIPEKLKALKILIVDDDETIRELCKASLNANGFDNIWEAADAKSALTKLHDICFDMVICDWNMPNITGLDLLQRVRSDEKLRNIAFLMVTAMSDKENVTQAIQAGVNDFIAKPFEPDSLCSKVVTAYARNQDQIKKRNPSSNPGLRII